MPSWSYVWIIFQVKTQFFKWQYIPRNLIFLKNMEVIVSPPGQLIVPTAPGPGQRLLW